VTQKIVALGDVHGQWAEVWGALRVAGLAENVCEPTATLLGGHVRLLLLGDLVHYKDAESYARAVGEEVFDAADPRQLRRAAKAQIRELYRFKSYMDRSSGAVSVILGNHDEVALTRRYTLTSRGGLEHNEFDPDKGGVALPDELGSWIANFPRQEVLGGVHFAHAGPLPGMQHYDDFFYHDPDTKGWWRDKPELARQSGHRFGVYGHTVMPNGIYLDRGYLFAMVDALHRRQFLELSLDDDDLYAEVKSF
jgi:hypothetical protein